MIDEKEITVVEAKEMIEDLKIIQLIDVRPTEEFQKGSIEKFRNIPYNELSKEIPSLDNKQRIFLLCHNGTISVKAQQLLEACGLKATIIRGGLHVWNRVFNPLT